MVPTSANATSGQPLGSSRNGAMPLKFYWARCKLAQSWWIWVRSCESFCQCHLAPASVPVAMVLATIYLYYVPWHMRKPLGWKIGINSASWAQVVEYKPSQKRAKLFEALKDWGEGHLHRVSMIHCQDLQMKVVHRPSECELTAGVLT